MCQTLQAWFSYPAFRLRVCDVQLRAAESASCSTAYLAHKTRCADNTEPFAVIGDMPRHPSIGNAERSDEAGGKWRAYLCG